MTIELKGNWNKGLAYDIHTLDSTYLGVDESGRERWENKRSEMGSLVYGLKYRSQKQNVPKIIDLISAKIKGLETYDFIIPMPPSKTRPFQPVYLLAEELGRRKKVKVGYALEKVKPKRELKNISGVQERKNDLEQTMKLTGDYNLLGKTILLLDDVYDSGATIGTATDILKKQAKADKVNVLTMTKTRTN